MFRIDRNTVSFVEGQKPVIITAAESVRSRRPDLPDFSTSKEDAKTQVSDAPTGKKTDGASALLSLEEARAQLEVAQAELASAHEEAEATLANAQAEAQALLSAAHEEAARAHAEAEVVQAEADATRQSSAQMREEAARAVATAQLQVDDLEREASERGHAEGLLKGQEEGQAAFDRMIADANEKLQSAMEHINQERQALLDTAERACVNLAMEVAKKVLGAAMQYDENTFLHLIQQGLDNIKHAGNVTIYVSPQEYGLFFAEDPDGLSTEMLHVHAVEDPTLTSGSLLLSSDSEKVDAGIDTQLDAVREAFDELGGGQ